MRNALDIFYIMLMIKSLSSEPSEALVKSIFPVPRTNFAEPAGRKQKMLQNWQKQLKNINFVKR